MKQFFYVAVFCIACSTSAYSQAHNYRFRIVESSDAEVRKEAGYWCTKIFDISPAYNELTGDFSVKSDVDVMPDVFAEKLSAQGFTLESFIKDEQAIELPDPFDPKE